jgi:predicted nucleic acid-binding Zn ribbon protein
MKKTNDLPIGDVLQQMVRAFKLKDDLTKVTIEKVWEEKMGKMIATYTRSLTLKNRVLYVVIESASLRSELHMGRDKIRLRLNEAIGEDFLSEVIVS